ncbi:MAG: PqqD family peptide modification chaperone [Actinobacteria bacterium]|uniref:Unannotated protein n=1 Tax=freshwater metagenome TaxID=449393 RepID=A0A6J6RWG7_9ZZZZ|nr:PqqD family peptide modification chaperone [Actinomycetota bacterium]
MNTWKADDIPAASRQAAVAGEYGRYALLNLGDLAAPPLILRDTAGQLWELIDGRRTVSELVGVVADLFGVEAEDVEGRVVEFLGELEALGLVSAA